MLVYAATNKANGKAYGGCTRAPIAADYGVNRATISHLIKRASPCRA